MNKLELDCEYGELLSAYVVVTDLLSSAVDFQLTAGGPYSQI